MSAKPNAGLKPRIDEVEPISENDSGCYICGERPVGLAVINGAIRPVCREHSSTGGADE